MLNYFKCDDIPLWQIANGSHLFDIIPYFADLHDPETPKGEKSYVLNIDLHYFSGAALVCLRNYGERCPVCDYVDSLQQEGDCQNLYSLYKFRRRSLYNVVVLDSKSSEKKGIQIMNTLHWFMQRNLIALIRRNLSVTPELSSVSPSVKEVGEYLMRMEAFEKKKVPAPFYDEDKGYSIAFTKSGRGIQTKYTDHRFVKRAAPISKEILSQAFILYKLLCIPDFDEAYNFLYSMKDKR